MLGIQLRDASDRANNSRNSIEAERGAWTERLASSRDSLDAELAAAAKLHDAGLASAETLGLPGACPFTMVINDYLGCITQRICNHK